MKVMRTRLLVVTAALLALAAAAWVVLPATLLFGGMGPGVSPPKASAGMPGDTDGDFCPDANEQQTAPGSEMSGGRRDYQNPWDYFNPTQDGNNRVDDILAVVNQYFEDEFLPSPPNPPDTPNPRYHQKYDRTSIPETAAEPWRLGPPNGLQRVDDILHAVNSYFHDCGIGKQAVMSLNVKEGAISCDGSGKPTKCDVPADAPFTLSVSVNSLPGGPYDGFAAVVTYDPNVLAYSPKDPAVENVWPDKDPASPYALRMDSPGVVYHADVNFGVGSVHTGNIVDLQFSCLLPGSAKVALPVLDPAAGPATAFILPGAVPPDIGMVPANTVAQQDIDLDGDTIPDLLDADVADTLVLNCGGNG